MWPALLALIALLGGGILLRELLSEKTAGKTLAILGDSRSGKTTFVRLLADGIIGDDTYSRTVVDTPYKGRKIELDNGATLHVGDLKDVPGEPSAWLTWKKRVLESDHVLYLVRSPAVRSDSKPAIDRCRRDLQQLRTWLEAAEAEKTPSVLLIFSFRDQDPNKAKTADYAAETIANAGLKEAVDALARSARVEFLSGSLATQETADKLLEKVGKKL